jgi:hypothetical protein
LLRGTPPGILLPEVVLGEREVLASDDAAALDDKTTNPVWQELVRRFRS